MTGLISYSHRDLKPFYGHPYLLAITSAKQTAYSYTHFVLILTYYIRGRALILCESNLSAGAVQCFLFPFSGTTYRPWFLFSFVHSVILLPTRCHHKYHLSSLTLCFLPSKPHFSKVISIFLLLTHFSTSNLTFSPQLCRTCFGPGGCFWLCRLPF